MIFSIVSIIDSNIYSIMGGSEDVSDKKKHHNLTIGIIAFLVLVNVGVHHTSQSGNSNEYAGVQFREKKSKSANSQQKSSNEEYAEPADEVQDVVTRWQSVWQQEHAAVNAACKPIEDMLVAGERSGRASFEGTVIGYRKKPGNVSNGLKRVQITFSRALSSQLGSVARRPLFYPL